MTRTKEDIEYEIEDIEDELAWLHEEIEDYEEELLDLREELEEASKPKPISELSVGTRLRYKGVTGDINKAVVIYSTGVAKKFQFGSRAVLLLDIYGEGKHDIAIGLKYLFENGDYEVIPEDEEEETIEELKGYNLEEDLDGSVWLMYRDEEKGFNWSVLNVSGKGLKRAYGLSSHLPFSVEGTRVKINE